MQGTFRGLKKCGSFLTNDGEPFRALLASGFSSDAGQRAMKGIDLAERYYHEFGAPLIRTGFSRFEDRIAAGLVGDGSDCYGYDNEVSRDHDWGPGFCLWLSQEDYDIIGRDLQLQYNKLPPEFLGFARKTSAWGAERVGVFEIGSFYRRFIGRTHAPRSAEKWLVLPEEYLSACTNGKVFHDPLGKFTRIREELLEFYPEDVRLLKIAARCVSAAQAGQYNYLRCIRHGEHFAAQYAETKFSADILSLAFLLNRTFAPYFKWRHRAARSLPVLGDILYQDIARLVASRDHKKKADIIEGISAHVIHELRSQGISDASSDFLLDHGPSVRKKIRDKSLIRHTTR